MIMNIMLGWLLMMITISSLGWEEVSSGRDSSTTARAQQNFIFIRSKQVIEEIIIIVTKWCSWKSMHCHFDDQGGTLTSISREWRSLKRFMRIMFRFEFCSFVVIVIIIVMMVTIFIVMVKRSSPSSPWWLQKIKRAIERKLKQAKELGRDMDTDGRSISLSSMIIKEMIKSPEHLMCHN